MCKILIRAYFFRVTFSLQISRMTAVDSLVRTLGVSIKARSLRSDLIADAPSKITLGKGRR